MKLRLLLSTLLGLATIHAGADWQPYFGIGVSGENNDFKTTVNDPYLSTEMFSGDTTNASAPFNFNAYKNSIMPTAEIGIGNTFDNNIYLGFEVNASYNNTTANSNIINDTAYNGSILDNAFTDQVVTKLSWQTSALVRLGLYTSQNFMPFIEAGASAVEAQSTYNFTNIPDAVSSSQGLVFSAQNNSWLWGPTVGIGGDYKLTQNLHLFGKADYSALFGSGTPGVNETAYGRSTFVGVDFPSSIKQDYRLNAWSAELGANYYF